MLKFKILFQMTGSIACYKACNVISKLSQGPFEVQVVASHSALKFVGAATLEGLTGKKVIHDSFEQGHMMDHIHLVRWADLIITAPATANFINKAACGIGDDLILTQFLAHTFQKPYLIAPAMNTAMYNHPSTQSSLLKLKSMGYVVLDTDSGSLACGEKGWGRLLEPDTIYNAIQNRLKEKQNNPQEQKFNPLSRKKILITGGGTQEPIDPVRFITNKSSGKTASIIAEHLYHSGFDITYLHAENAILPNCECEKYSFSDFSSLQTKLNYLMENNYFYAVIHLAAISDYSVAHLENKKISSDSEKLTLELKKNPKLINAIKAQSKNKNVWLVGFKLTSGNTPAEVCSKIESIFFNADANLVIHNDTSEIGDTHTFHVYEKGRQITTIEGSQKLAQYFSKTLLETSPAFERRAYDTHT